MPAKAPHPVPDQHGVNLFTSDPGLQSLLSVYLAPELLAHITPRLVALGALAGGALDDLASTARVMTVPSLVFEDNDE